MFPEKFNVRKVADGERVEAEAGRHEALQAQELVPAVGQGLPEASNAGQDLPALPGVRRVAHRVGAGPELAELVSGLLPAREGPVEGDIEAGSGAGVGPESDHRPGV